MKTRLFHLHALSALHVGTGQGVGAVDLPIARSRATNLPIVAGSAIKGVLRDTFETEKKLDKKTLNALFGADVNTDSVHAGAVAFGDAQLLLLPVRSFAGTVAYATCPFILKRYQRDTQSTFPIPNIEEAIVVSGSLLEVNSKKIALEDVDIAINEDQNANTWAEQIAQAVYPNNEEWQAELKQRFVILPDNIFSFLSDTATEIRTRIKIDRDTRIVAQGALWSEENLPCETVLWGVLGIHESRDKSGKTADDLNQLIPSEELNIQIGGKHTVGRGLCRLLISEAK